jgi:hypothetical protein
MTADRLSWDQQSLGYESDRRLWVLGIAGYIAGLPGPRPAVSSAGSRQWQVRIVGLAVKGFGRFRAVTPDQLLSRAVVEQRTDAHAHTGRYRSVRQQRPLRGRVEDQLNIVDPRKRRQSDLDASYVKRDVRRPPADADPAAGSRAMGRSRSRKLLRPVRHIGDVPQGGCAERNGTVRRARRSPVPALGRNGVRNIRDAEAERFSAPVGGQAATGTQFDPVVAGFDDLVDKPISGHLARVVGESDAPRVGCRPQPQPGLVSGDDGG